VLTGYSQGALVVNRALVALGAAHSTVLGQVTAVELIADPQRLGGSSYLQGNAPTNLSGLSAVLGRYPPDQLPATVASVTGSWCHAGDIVCAMSQGVAKQLAALLTAPIPEKVVRAIELVHALKEGSKIHAGYADRGEAHAAGVQAAHRLAKSSAARRPAPVAGGHPGIAVVSCTNVVEVDFVDPATGRTASSVSFPEPEGGAPLFLCNLFPGAYARGSFDPQFNRMVVSFSENDGSSHVGYEDSAGRVTDVTQQLTPSSFASVPNQVDPLFGADGSFFFEDRPDMQVFSVSANGSGPAQPRGPVSTTAFALGPNDEILPVTQEAYGAGQPIPNPSGSEWVDSSFDAAGIAVGAPGQLADVSISADTSQICHPQAWVDNYRVLCSMQTKGNINVSSVGLVTFDAGYGSASLSELTPTTDRAIDSIVVSPDGTEYAFTSTQGSELSLYVSSLSGGEPRLVESLGASHQPSPPALLEWR
jgi:hypothetical protein